MVTVVVKMVVVVMSEMVRDIVALVMVMQCPPGPTMAPTGQQYDSKSGQWLGSTLQSSGEDGTILV